jgi:hypothetical protein
MKSVKLNGNPELTEKSVLWAVAAVLEQDSQSSFDVVDGDILEYEPAGDTIYWKVEKFHYDESEQIIIQVDLDC